MDEEGNRIRRIGGPYPSSEAADEASRAVSAEMGERPVEGYTERLRQTNPGVIGGQSPIPDQYRQYTPPGQPGISAPLISLSPPAIETPGETSI